MIFPDPPSYPPILARGKANFVGYERTTKSSTSISNVDRRDRLPCVSVACVQKVSQCLGGWISL